VRHGTQAVVLQIEVRELSTAAAQHGHAIRVQPAAAEVQQAQVRCQAGHAAGQVEKARP
jgi:hypothetical protein